MQARLRNPPPSRSDMRGLQARNQISSDLIWSACAVRRIDTRRCAKVECSMQRSARVGSDQYCTFDWSVLCLASYLNDTIGIDMLPAVAMILHSSLEFNLAHFSPPSPAPFFILSQSIQMMPQKAKNTRRCREGYRGVVRLVGLGSTRGVVGNIHLLSR